MRKTIFFIVMCVATVASAQITNWQHIGDSIEYVNNANAKVGIRTNNPQEVQ